LTRFCRLPAGLEDGVVGVSVERTLLRTFLITPVGLEGFQDGAGAGVVAVL
jgi:hypothetical protein